MCRSKEDECLVVLVNEIWCAVFIARGGERLLVSQSELWWLSLSAEDESSWWSHYLRNGGCLYPSRKRAHGSLSARGMIMICSFVRESVWSFHCRRYDSCLYHSRADVM